MNTIWDWTRQTLLPGLHPPPLYDGLQSEPYIADRMSLPLGVVRLRQARVQKGNRVLTSTSFLGSSLSRGWPYATNASSPHSVKVDNKLTDC